VQLAEVTLHETRWWTLAVKTIGMSFPEVPTAFVEFVDLAAEYPGRSYPAWLLERAKPDRLRSLEQVDHG
jgi:hypothetical protein